MASLYKEIMPAKAVYWDRKSGLSLDQWKKQLEVSTTIYVGNLSFWTQEEQIWELFSKCGNLVALTMGLNKFKKQPCGFCFVQYRTHEEAVRAVHVLKNAKLDGRSLTVDLDAVGVTDGRQYGRGETGGQWRDDMRKGFDAQRGGDGKDLLKKVNGTDGCIYTGKNFHRENADEDKTKKKKDGDKKDKKKRHKTDDKGEKKAKRQKT
ncbi:unnamed protein product [Amoebophrya sp. A120]|nr:unnamed protein product [Amoebophrya sp. A120]|eukprot:GSA120T00005310001.1